MSRGDAAFMVLATAMVCLMTPGLAFFYGGLAQKKNVLVMMMQSFIAMGIVTLIWIFGGFSLVFGHDIGGLIGNIGDFFALHNVTAAPNAMYGPRVPFIMFFAFQLMFCVITVPLMTGAFAERMRMKTYIWFLIIWTILIYIPVAHWVWGNGFLQKWGFVDFAGGAVIHTTAGFGALVCVLVLGSRNWEVKHNYKPNNLMAAAIGTGLLWFGWFGFNSGGALAANKIAAIAFANTFIGLASGMVTWILFKVVRKERVNFTDVLTGSVAGLATVTPCAGYIKPIAAVVVGIVAGIICHLAVMFRESRDWDDALDVWGVHGVGGFVGILLVGILASANVNGISASFHQFFVQVVGILIITGYAMLMTYLIITLLKKLMRVEPTKEEQLTGLDAIEFGSETYDE